MIDAPSGGAPEQAPRWDLLDTESYGGGIRVLTRYLIVWGYVGIYRRKEYVGGATGGPRGWRACPGGVGAPPTVVSSSFLPGRGVQVHRVAFVPKITSPVDFVPFRLRLIFLFFETLKYAKKIAILGWASG